MSVAALDHTYRYAFASEAGPAALTLATSGGVSEFPHLFRGRLTSPRSTADILLSVSEISRTRFYTPPGMLKKILLAADPVVTCGGERLRWEAFSACCGVYVRLDLDPTAWHGDFLGQGTTNVDFHPDMRRALTQVRDSLELSVGTDHVRVETVVERKVPLPLRWIKGFVEVQAIQSRMTLVAAVSADEARRFLRSLSAQDVRGTATLGPAGKGVRLSQTGGGAAVGGVGRLKFLQDVIRYAVAMDVYGAVDGSTAWVLHFKEGRLHTILSPEASRGFSGEGQVLSLLADKSWQKGLSLLRAQLNWQAHIDPASAGLAALGAQGLVGYDVTAGAYFHRELPFDIARVDALQPRLLEAQKLVDSGGVQREGAHTYVREHHVRQTSDGWRCSCPWFARYQGQRGPCKHILAAQITGSEPQK